ncbi:MAG: hypothetical protein O9284_16410 [Steroidobacteraceae bacterium]|jgi:hypothetical protein|nr:hypothetical protein [Steroidobacteraceae bacterium]
MFEALKDHIPAIVAELPAGVEFRPSTIRDHWTLVVNRRVSEFASDDAVRAWVIQTLNAFANVLRSRLALVARNGS